MITVQGRQHRTYKPPRWYALQLQLHYKAISKHGPAYGFGHTRMMSGRDIIFASDDELEPGMTAQILVDWPRLLDDGIRLQLGLQVTITGSKDGVAEASVWAYDFRTSRRLEAEQRAEAAGV